MSKQRKLKPSLVFVTETSEVTAEDRRAMEAADRNTPSTGRGTSIQTGFNAQLEAFMDKIPKETKG